MTRAERIKFTVWGYRTVTTRRGHFLGRVLGEYGSGDFDVTKFKAALLSLAMISAITVCGVGIYAADAANNHAVVDGYGVIASR